MEIIKKEIGTFFGSNIGFNKNLITFTKVGCGAYVSIDINDIIRISEANGFSRVYFVNEDSYLNVKESVQDIEQMVNDIKSGKEIESGTKATNWTPSPDNISGIQLILDERERQVREKGYTAEHDDSHSDGQLSVLAEKYMFGSMTKINPTTEERIVELSKAGALIAAEIDRLQRLKP